LHLLCIRGGGFPLFIYIFIYLLFIILTYSLYNYVLIHQSINHASR